MKNLKRLTKPLVDKPRPTPSARLSKQQVKILLKEKDPSAVRRTVARTRPVNPMASAAARAARTRASNMMLD